MDIRKTDNKGRIALGDKDRHFFVRNKKDGGYNLEPVPVVDAVPDGREYAWVSSAKDTVADIVSDALDAWGVDQDDDCTWRKHGPIHVADLIIETLMSKGVTIPEGYRYL